MACSNASIAVSTDVVLFSIHRERLEVLVLGPEDLSWRLPGGLAGASEDLDTSARRHLKQQTGIQKVYLEQLYTFGQPNRNPRQRVVSVAYYALFPIEKLPVLSGKFGMSWFPVKQLPGLILDHAEVVSMAHHRLAAKLAYSTIALQCMPRQFTLSDLQSVYETILGETLDKRNFRKRVLAMDCIEATGEVARRGNHRPAKLYRVTDPNKIDFIK